MGAWGNYRGRGSFGKKSIINSAGKLTRLKHGVRQGFINGDTNKIFNNMTRYYNSKIQTKGREMYFESGNIRVGIHNSAKGNSIPTIHIKDNNREYKIRVIK